jgi:hypothetical protein
LNVGWSLNRQGWFHEAAEVMREAFEARAKIAPDVPETFFWMGAVGDPLTSEASALKGKDPVAADEKFTEAESLILASYKGLVEREAKMSPQVKKRLSEPLRHLVRLYTEWEKPDEKAKWQAVLDTHLAEQPK